MFAPNRLKKNVALIAENQRTVFTFRKVGNEDSNAVFESDNLSANASKDVSVGSTIIACAQRVC